jgi:protein-tyrosine phosphatase
MNFHRYSITKLSPTGDPIVRELVIYKIPHLKNEVMQILKHRKHAKV